MSTRLNVHALAEPLPRPSLAERLGDAADAADAGLSVQVLHSNTFVNEAVGNSRRGDCGTARGGAGGKAGRQCGGLQQLRLCKRSFSRASGSWQEEPCCVTSKVVTTRTITLQALWPHRAFLERQ